MRLLATYAPPHLHTAQTVHGICDVRALRSPQGLASAPAGARRCTVVMYVLATAWKAAASLMPGRAGMMYRAAWGQLLVPPAAASLRQEGRLPGFPLQHANSAQQQPLNSCHTATAQPRTQQPSGALRLSILQRQGGPGRTAGHRWCTIPALLRCTSERHVGMHAGRRARGQAAAALC